MKKGLSLLLTAALLCALALPAAAAGGTEDARLAQVTGKVKQTLGIPDTYESFYGERSADEVTPYWRLNWEDEDRSLTVLAGEDAKIYRYSYSERTSSEPGGASVPSFPNLSAAQAREAAQTFVDGVLTAGESARFAAEETGARQADVTQYQFSGTVLLKGLDSPIGFSITVRAEDGKVLRFSRDDLYTKYLGGVPSATAKADRAQAGGLLRDTLSLRLEYVLTEDGKSAVLRYLPEDTDRCYVDAQSGKLVNLTQLLDELWSREDGALGGGSANSTAAEAAADKGSLTQAELDGIGKLEGVLDKDALDRKARAWRELGLSAYTLTGCDYAVDRETGDVTASLQYAKKVEDGVWRRSVTLEAKTGALLGVYSSAPYREDWAAAVSLSDAQDKAESFLGSLWAGDFGKTALYQTGEAVNDTGHRFTYAQRENGYFFPENSLTIRIDATDGSVSALSRSFDAHPDFDSPEGILSAQEALDAYFATFDVTLSYLAVPRALDLSDPVQQPLIELGYRYLYALTLSYSLTQEERVVALDAKSGQCVYWAREDAAITYSDLDGHWGQAQAQKLADYGIGWLGGVCAPASPLTQLDLMALLASTQGYLYQPNQEGGADSLYQYAYSMGLLTKGERQDDKPITRAELVKVLLDAAGYGRTARIPGIFRCSFADQADIPAAYYGYAAIAQGLGIVSGDGNFAPNRTATRMEALTVLYNYMSL